MLPWSSEKMKYYIEGRTYNYIHLIGNRVNPITKEITHPIGEYKLISPFVYAGKKPSNGFKISDGTILDSTFCELI